MTTQPESSGAIEEYQFDKRKYDKLHDYAMRLTAEHEQLLDQCQYLLDQLNKSLSIIV